MEDDIKSAVQDVNLTTIQSDVDGMAGVEEEKPEQFSCSPIFNTPSFSLKSVHAARRKLSSYKSVTDMESAYSRSSLLGTSHFIPIENNKIPSRNFLNSPQVPTPCKRVYNNATPPSWKDTQSAVRLNRSYSDEDLFATVPQSTVTSAEIIPSGLGTLLEGPEHSDLSWTSSMATPLTGNATWSYLNTEERKTLLPSDNCSLLVKPRALFSPDPNETVGCQSLNHSSDLEHVETTKSGHQNGAHCRRTPHVKEPLLTGEVVGFDVSVCKPGYKYLDSLCSPVQSKLLKKDEVACSKKENVALYTRAESPVLSGSSLLSDISTVKKLFADQEDPFQDLGTSCHSEDISSGLKRKSNLVESTPNDLSKRRNSLGESVSLTSTPNVCNTNESFLQDISVTALEEICKAQELKAFKSPLPSGKQLEFDYHVRRKRLDFTEDWDIDNNQKVEGRVEQSNLSQNLDGNSRPSMNECSIPDDSFMEHVATIRTSGANSPKTKVLAIKNSYCMRSFCYLSVEPDNTQSERQSPPASRPSSLKDVLESASTLEAVSKMENPMKCVKPTEGLIAFSKLKMSPLNPVDELTAVETSQLDAISIEDRVLSETRCLSSSPGHPQESGISMRPSLSADELCRRESSKSPASDKAVDNAALQLKNLVEDKDSYFVNFENIGKEIKIASASASAPKVPHTPIDKRASISVREAWNKTSIKEHGIKMEKCAIQSVSKQSNESSTSSYNQFPECVLSHCLPTKNANLHASERCTMIKEQACSIQSGVCTSGDVSMVEKGIPLDCKETKFDENEELPLGDQHVREIIKKSIAVDKAPSDISHMLKPLWTSDGRKNKCKNDPDFSFHEKEITSSAITPGDTMLCLADNKSDPIADSTMETAMCLIFNDSFTVSSTQFKSPEDNDGSQVALDSCLKHSANIHADYGSKKNVHNNPNLLNINKSSISCHNFSVATITPGKKNNQCLENYMCRKSSSFSEIPTSVVKLVPVSDAAPQNVGNILAKEDKAVDIHIKNVKGSKPHGQSGSVSNPALLNAQSPMTGFSTACGKLVPVSDAALQRAQKVFEEANENLDEENVTKSRTKSASVSSPALHRAPTAFSGFSTASGAFVPVSDTALQKAQKFFEEVNENVETNVQNVTKTRIYGKSASVSSPALHKAQTPLSGFSTAGGKLVPVSNAALQKARNVFEEIYENEETTMENVKKSINFGKSASVSSPALPNAQTALSGFSTASGKFVQVSDTAIKKAQKVFEEINENEETNMKNVKESINFGKSASVSSPALHKAPTALSGFSTASGTFVPVSDTALQKARKCFEEMNENVETNVENVAKSRTSGNSASVSSPAVHKTQIPFSGFSTAGGKLVPVSDAALQEARKVFAEINENEETNMENVKTSMNFGKLVSVSSPALHNAPTVFSGFSTASGKFVPVSDTAIKKARKVFEEINENEETNMENVKESINFGKSASVSSPALHKAPTALSGFSTASGKFVPVSDTALQKARKCFEEMNENVETNVENVAKSRTSGNSASVSNPALHKTQIPLSGFSTAGGKLVPVSDAALQKARKVFEDVTENEETNMENVKESINLGKSACNSCPDLHKAPTASSGFSTASGIFVPVSDTALRKAQKVFEEVSENVKEYETNGESTSVSSAISSKAETFFEGVVELKSSISDLGGFATARGTLVSVSNGALHNAQELFEGLDDRQISGVARKLFSSTTELKQVVSGSVGKSAELRASDKFTSASYSFPTISETTNYLNELPSEYVKGLGENPPAVLVNNIGQDGMEDSGIFVSHEDTKMDINTTKGMKSSVGLFRTPAEKRYPDVRSTSLFNRNAEANGKVKLPIVQDSGTFNAVVNNSLFIDDGFFNDSESMNALSNVMASVCTSPSMVTDRGSILKPVISSESQDSGNTFEPTSPILVRSQNMPKKRPRKGRLSLTNSSLRRSSKSSSESSIRSGALGAKIHSTSESEVKIACPFEKDISCGSSRSVFDRTVPLDQKNLSNALREKEVWNFKCDQSLPENIAMTHQDLECASAGKRPRIVASVVQEVVSKQPNETLWNSSNIKEANTAASAASGTEILGISSSVRQSFKESPSDCLKPKIRPALKRTLPSHDSGLDSPEVKRTRRSSNVYSTAIWPPCEPCPGDEKRLRPEVAEMRKRAAEEQKELVDCHEVNGVGIRPYMGSRLSRKLSSKDKLLTWMKAVNGARPEVFSQEKLFSYGVIMSVASVTSRNAVDFRFSAWDFYSADVCRENVSGIPVGDGALLVLDSKGEAGFHEIKRAFLASPGVDPNLVSSAWIRNHYRWIVWKLASLERSYPQLFGGQCLTPHEVMQQMKYRYDREIDRCERPALRRILELDDSAAKRMVLCVADIKPRETGHDVQDVQLELTDGWYSVMATLDSEMQNRVSRRTIQVGTKLLTHGAELLNCSQGCSPLEVSPDVGLRLFTNSTRRARWFAKLGFQQNPGPIRIPLYSILGSGGLVSSVTTCIARVYPVVFVEKGEKTVIRSDRAEQRESALMERRKQDLTEQAYSQVKAEEHREQSCRKPYTVQPTPRQVASISSGEELFRLLENASDPGSLQSMMTEKQKTLVAAFRSVELELERRRVEKLVQKKLSEISTCERQVTPLLKVRLIDVQKEKRVCTAILSVWRPNEDMLSVFKEGHKITVLGSNAAGFRGGELQLSVKGSTRYNPRGPEPLGDFSRVVSPLADLLVTNFKPSFGEVDVVGLIIRIGPAPKTSGNNSFHQTAYLSDSYHNIVGISFAGSLKDLAYDDIVVCNAFVAGSNLQYRGSPVLRSISCIYANETSTFTTKPRLPHLQRAMQELRQSISSNVESFSKIAGEKLDQLFSQKAVPTLSPRTPLPTESSGQLVRAGHFSTPDSLSKRPLTINAQRKLVLDNEKIHSPAREYSPSVQRRLAKLEMYADPPPLSPILLCEPRKVLRRSFQAPRRMDNIKKDSPPISPVKNIDS